MNPTPEQVDAARAYEGLHVPALMAEWAPRVLDAASVEPGHAVLDVACGTGILARTARARVGDRGSVTGLDASPGMLAVAAELTPDVTWREGTAESLPFDDGGFDAVVSQFGLMFVEDRVKAVREMLRVVAPAGTVAVAVWDALERSDAYPISVDLLARLAGEPAAEALRAPFVLGDSAQLEALFRDAGASSVQVSTVVGRARFPGIRVMVEADLRGWLPVMGVHLDEATIQRVLDEADRALAGYVAADGRLEFNAPAHIVVARPDTTAA